MKTLNEIFRVLMSKLTLSLIMFFVTASAFAETRTAQQMLNDLGFHEKKGVIISNPDCNASYELADDGTLSVIINSTWNGKREQIQIKQDFEFQNKDRGKSYRAKTPSGEQFRVGFSSYSEMLEVVLINHLACEVRSEDLKVPNPALEVSLMADAGGYDSSAEKALYQIVGKGISDQTLDQFVILGEGDEGGAVYCIELNQSFQGRRAERTMKQLESDITSQVKPNKSTPLTLKRVANCKKSGT